MKLFRNKTCQFALTFCLISLEFPIVAMGEVHWRSTCNRGCVPKHNYGHDTKRFSSTGFAVANDIVVDSTQRRKPFHLRATSIKLDHLQLDQIGLAILESDGQVIMSGRFNHTGGDGGLSGSNVTIRIRAYIAASPDPIQIPPDAVVVWSSESSVWVPRGQKQFNLTPSDCTLDQQEEISRNFARITHLEVEMEYRRDR